MADDLTRLAILIEANTKSYERAMQKIQQQTDRAMKGASASGKRVEKSLLDIERAAGFAGRSILTMLGPLAGAVSIGGFKELADAALRIENALKVAGLAGEELDAVYQKLLASAQKNAAPIEALTELYSRASLVQKELGVSTEELLNFTDKVAVALRVSGKSASESSGALLQLSQALGSGVVRAEEFNSVLEGALPIAQAAAAGLKEAGGSVAKLRTLVVDGKVSSEAFFRAFEAGSRILEEKVAGSTFTTAQGFVILNNTLTDTAGKLDAVIGFTAKAGNVLTTVSDIIKNVTTVFEELANSGVGHLVGEISHLNDVLFELIPGLNAYYKLAGKSNIFKVGQRQPTEITLTKGANKPPVSLSDFKPPAAQKKGLSQAEKDARVVQREQQAIAEYLDTLRQEHDLIGATTLEREKANAVRRLGMSATDAQIDAVERLIESNYREQQSWEGLQAAQDFYATTAFDALMSVVDGSKSAADAVADLTKQFAKAALQAVLLGQGPLAQLFGTTSPTGGVGGIFGTLFGRPMAGGGAVAANVPRVIGEHGPELFIPRTAGAIVANQNIPSGSTTQNIIINNQPAPGYETQSSQRRAPNGDIIIDQIAKRVMQKTGQRSMATIT